MKLVKNKSSTPQKSHSKETKIKKNTSKIEYWQHSFNYAIPLIPKLLYYFNSVENSERINVM